MIEKIQPHYPACYALLSGGKDSITTAKVLADADRLKGCVTFNTGVSTPEWRDFVTDFCRKQNWSLDIIDTPAVYDDLVVKFGFPGPAKHGWFMSYLKGRCVRKFRQRYPGEILASGVRADESERRFGNTRPVSVWEGVPIMAPIYQWTTEAVWKYFRAHKFKRSPAYETIKISGDCCCGAYATPEEPDLVAYHYPELYKRFEILSHRITGKYPKRCEWGWGHSDPTQLLRRKTAREAAICVECGDTAPIKVQ